MSNNLFFYNRVERIEEDGKEVEKVFRDSLNINLVLRTIQMADNLIVVILNDGREEKFEIPVAVKGKTEYQSQRKFIQTQIPIEGVDQVEAFLNKYDQIRID